MQSQRDPTVAFFSRLNKRKSPRARWLAFTSRYFDPLVIASSAAPILIVGFRSHPYAASVSALGILVFALSGYSLERWPLRVGHQHLPTLRTVWSFLGFGAVLLIYTLLVRGSPPATAVSLWPLLIYAMYFALRIINKLEFIPYVVSVAVLLPIFSLLVVTLTRVIEFDVPVFLATTIWLMIILFGIVAHVRTWDHYATRFEAFRELVRWAGSIDADLADVQSKIDTLGTSLSLDRLAVLRIMRPPNSREPTDPAEFGIALPEGADARAFRIPKHVEIIGKYVQGKAKNAAIPPWPLTRGLLAKAYRERMHVICEDTHAPTCSEFFFNPPNAEAFRDTRCELVQPIFESPNGQIIGFIDLQSREPRSLHTQELDYLAALASAIAPLLIKERLGTLLSGMETLRHALHHLDDERDVFEQIARFACDYLDVDVVTYYRLGFGNGWPLTPVWHTGAWFPAWLEGKLLRPGNVPPVSLVSRWETTFMRDPEKDARALQARDGAPVRDYFVTRERIRASAFLPIGTRPRRIGALFLNYRDPQQFSPATELALEIFRQTIAPHLERTRQLADAHDGFGQISLVLHDLVRDSIATHVAIVPHLTRLREAIEQNDGHAATEHFQKLSAPLQLHTDYVRTASLKFNLAAGKLLRNGLGLALATASGVMEQRYAGRGLRCDIDSAIEQLPADLHLALFSIVTEAGHNAVQSGNAHVVNVSIYSKTNHIEAQVTSDGNAWNPNAPVRPYSQYGIHARLELARELMASEYEWSSDGRGLTLRIPILPHLDGRGSYGQ
jgi:putative methionine-R-sulfoxide reductase with GAF domain